MLTTRFPVISRISWEPVIYVPFEIPILESGSQENVKLSENLNPHEQVNFDLIIHRNDSGYYQAFPLLLCSESEIFATQCKLPLSQNNLDTLK